MWLVKGVVYHTNGVLPPVWPDDDAGALRCVFTDELDFRANDGACRCAVWNAVTHRCWQEVSMSHPFCLLGPKTLHVVPGVRICDRRDEWAGVGLRTLLTVYRGRLPGC